MESRRQIGIATGLSWAFFIGRMSITPIFPLYAISVGATLLEVGLILSLYPLTTILTRVPFGVLVRRWGGWPLIHLAFTLQYVSSLMFFLAPSPPWLFPTMILYALASSAFGPTAASLTLNLTSPGGRGMALGKYYTSIGLAMASGPLITSLLTRYFDFREIFLLLSLIPLAGALALIKLRIRGSTHPPLTGETGVKGFKTVPRILKRRSMLAITAATTVFFIVNGMFEALFPVYGREQLLITPSLISLLFALRGGLNTFIRIPSGRLSDLVGRRTPILLGYGLAAAGFLILSTSVKPLIAALGMMIIGLGWGLRVPPSSAIIGDSIPVEETPVAMAVLWMSADVGSAIGSALSGPLSPLAPMQWMTRYWALTLAGGFLIVLLGLESGVHGRSLGGRSTPGEGEGSF